MSFEIVKAGWLFRQSSLLKRWKRHWFVLYADGILRFFETQSATEADDAYRIRPECVGIKGGKQVPNVTPPEGHSSDCLLQVDFTANRKLVLCADTFDDHCAWKLSLEDARIVHQAGSRPMTAPPPGYVHQYYQAAPGTNVIYTNGYGAYSHPPPYVVQNPDGTQTTVIVDNNRYPRYYRRGYDGTDVAMGVVAGAAIGSMMWGPMLWW